MKKIIIFTVVIACFTNTGYSQVDSLFKTNGDVLLINVKEVTESSIKFIYPGEDFLNTISKSAVTRIKFKSGRTQEFSSALNVLEVKSCLDWEKVQVSRIESEVVGLEKIDHIGTKAKGMTTLSSLVKLQDRAYNKMKMASAMLGGNVVYILDQNTEEAIDGGEYGPTKLPGVTVSGMVYTSQKVNVKDISYGTYQVYSLFELSPNRFEMKPVEITPELIDVVDKSVVVENGYPQIGLKSKNVKKVNNYTIISADEDKMVLSGIAISKGGKKTYYNLFLRK